MGGLVLEETYRLSPPRNKTRDILAKNRFAEDSSAEDVSNGSVWRAPHLLQLKFLDTSFVWGDSSTLYCNVVFLCGL